MKRIGFLASLAATGGLVIMLLGQVGAHGAGTQQVNLAATTFEGVDKSPHNDGVAAEPDACASQASLQEGDDHFGDLNNSQGSFEQFVQMPNGVSVKNFSVFANDNDGDFDIHAYLIRKLIVNGTTPKESGYTVMAQADGSGAQNSVVRKFTDSSVTGAKVNNLKYMYYVEIVLCTTTIEPFGAQVVYAT